MHTPLSGNHTIAGLMTGDQLTRWREFMGLSVTRAAAMLGVSRATYYSWAKGSVPIPKIAELACAALSLGVRSYPPVDSSSSVRPDPSVVLAAPFSGPPGPPGPPLD